ASASCAACIAYRVTGSNSARSDAHISAYARSSSGQPATTGGHAGSAATGRMPDLPARSISVISGTEFPSAPPAPHPVTTTLCVMAALLDGDELVYANREVVQRLHLRHVAGGDRDAVITLHGPHDIERRQ